jgi:hypothetical protein
VGNKKKKEIIQERKGRKLARAAEGRSVKERRKMFYVLSIV